MTHRIIFETFNADIKTLVANSSFPFPDLVNTSFSPIDLFAIPKYVIFFHFHVFVCAVSATKIPLLFTFQMVSSSSVHAILSEVSITYSNIDTTHIFSQHLLFISILVYYVDFVLLIFTSPAKYTTCGKTLMVRVFFFLKQVSKIETNILTCHIHCYGC